MSQLPSKKTKIIATIGPASQSVDMLKKMISNGMNIARLNFAHGDFDSHTATIAAIREAAAEVDQRVTIFGDLAGPKMRIGRLGEEPVFLQSGASFTLTTQDVVGDNSRVSLSFETLPNEVHPGDTIFLNDGFIQLQVINVDPGNVHTEVVVGGELRSHKGVNVPGIALPIKAFTDEDHAFLKFAAAQHLDAISLSFVQDGTDIEAVREAAHALNYHPFLIAKIERAIALDHIDDIIQTTDAVMVARGDLGVEIPIEEVVMVQKKLIQQAVIYGKPVITATQMLESMTYNTRPTRAEVSDVTNAIMDGTDCVMLSGESAMGIAPDNTVAVMARICVTAERYQNARETIDTMREAAQQGELSRRDLMSLNIYNSIELLKPAVIIVPTPTGGTARRISRYRSPAWTIGVSNSTAVCQNMQFSYGVYPIDQIESLEDMERFGEQVLKSLDLPKERTMVVERPHTQHDETIIRMNIIDYGTTP